MTTPHVMEIWHNERLQVFRVWRGAVRCYEVVDKDSPNIGRVCIEKDDWNKIANAINRDWHRKFDGLGK